MAIQRANVIPAGLTDEGQSVPPDRRGRKQHLDMRRDVRNKYAIRFSCCLVASLSLMLLTANLPITEGWRSVGWHVRHPDERMSIELIDASGPPTAKAGTPITGFEDRDNDGQFDNEKPSNATAEKALGGGDASSSTMVKPTPAKLQGRRVFDAAQRMPEIVGGIGSYYIHIEYPEEAMQAGIEGRLVLSFIVGVDGHTTEVEVVERLHPACDSAAVWALRRTRFVPGRQNGDTVPVRMRLPVRFELVEPDGDSSPRKSASS